MSADPQTMALAEACVGRNGSELVVHADRLDALRSALARVRQPQELLDTVEAMCTFALWLGKHPGGGAVREALLGVAEGCLPALMALALGADLGAPLGPRPDGEAYLRLTTPRGAPSPTPGPPAARRLGVESAKTRN